MKVYEGSYSSLLEEIRGRQVVVVGLARSGVAAARLLVKLGAARVVVNDHKRAEALRQELALLPKSPVLEPVLGGNDPALIGPGVSLVIKSPGVPPDLGMLQRAASMEIPVLSEIELAYAFIKAPIVGITGTNGKTTTTALTAAILKEARFHQVFAAGNIGWPLCDLVGKVEATGIVVAELSSFQLENIRSFRPAVAVVLNFSQDHLNYHGSLENYFAAKARILENQGPGDFAVLNAADGAVAELQYRAPGPLLWFGSGKRVPGVGVEEGWVYLYSPTGERQAVCPVEEIALPGEHNLENALAASAAAWAAGAEAEAIGRTLRRFKAIEHRLEFVASVQGVDFINDSKGTNPEATIKALRAFPGRRKLLIAGGKDKGSDFRDLARVIKEEVDFLVVLGETADRIIREVEEAGFGAYRKVGSLEEAVEEAWRRSRAGDLVLLSPACASWDMFSSYEERGNRFKELVRQIKP